MSPNYALQPPRFKSFSQKLSAKIHWRCKSVKPFHLLPLGCPSGRATLKITIAATLQCRQRSRPAAPASLAYFCTVTHHEVSNATRIEYTSRYSPKLLPRVTANHISSTWTVDTTLALSDRRFVRNTLNWARTKLISPDGGNTERPLLSRTGCDYWLTRRKNDDYVFNHYWY